MTPAELRAWREAGAAIERARHIYLHRLLHLTVDAAIMADDAIDRDDYDSLDTAITILDHHARLARSLATITGRDDT